MKKTIFILIGVVVLGLGGYYFFNGNSIPDAALAQLSPAQIEVSPATYDIGRVVMKEGVVTREYEIKNNSSDVLRLKKIVTSCMCTKAQVIAGDKKTRLYAMEMGGAVNPVIDFDIPANSTAKLIVKFDPAAHGIQGTGPIERTVSLTFVDPVGTREVGFSGEVVLK
ncbi:MAG: hypothetical protein US68_C0038G0005 [Candidatus Shapirobacteria bacterium GW2011_GWE1_38_10]|uniref:PF07610 family protein n=2 Tax=Microgenomates group TaxID=1794810 RepID=A0A0G0KGF7_9BACT|nr:MAG: hypothetical protein US68_C0038G0005 [Candidatus Shapirobacteria bacterium GW2011_GWE1_38_10]OGM87269.1 MAG: hypothetical protein A2594_01210 [Candidatus Woesebacteria bacterium RIFOXYD1_FULL_41_28]